MTIAARFLGQSLTQPPLPPYYPVYAQRFRATARIAARAVFGKVELYLDAAIKERLQTGKVVVYANHPGFWDPIMLALLTERLWPNHAVVSPIDGASLKIHRYFHGLGFFALDPASVSGLKRFSQVASAAWDASADTCLAVLPEGRFSPPGARRLKLRRGLAQALTTHQGPPPTVVPVAIHYHLGESPRPVAALAVGKPLGAFASTLGALHQSLEGALHSTLNELEDCLLENRPSTSLLRPPCR